MYVDESGDPGQSQTGSTDYFALSGLIVPAETWREVYVGLKSFRSSLLRQHGIPKRVELHAADLLHGSGEFFTLKPRPSTQQRLNIYKDFLSLLAGTPTLKVINLLVDKLRLQSTDDYDLFEDAWTRLGQRFENFLLSKGPSTRGLVFADVGRIVRTIKVLRKRRAYNPIPSSVTQGTYRNIPWTAIIEDPVFRNSRHSFFVQAADMICYSLLQREYPSSLAQHRGFTTYFEILNPILLKEASKTDTLGVVRIP